MPGRQRLAANYPAGGGERSVHAGTHPSPYRFLAWTMEAGEQDHLRRAEELVLEARQIVQQQKGRIIRLRAGGVDTWDAERTLRTLESNLKRFEQHRESLKRK